MADQETIKVVLLANMAPAIVTVVTRETPAGAMRFWRDPLPVGLPAPLQFTATHEFPEPPSSAYLAILDPAPGIATKYAEQLGKLRASRSGLVPGAGILSPNLTPGVSGGRQR